MNPEDAQTKPDEATSESVAPKPLNITTAVDDDDDDDDDDEQSDMDHVDDAMPSLLSMLKSPDRKVIESIISAFSVLVDAGVDGSKSIVEIVVRTEPSISALILEAAIACGNAKVAHALLDAGCNPNGEPPGVSPLCAACSAGSIEMVRLLIERGASVTDTYVPSDVTAPTTPLELATIHNRPDMVCAILDAADSQRAAAAAASAEKMGVKLPPSAVDIIFGVGNSPSTSKPLSASPFAISHASSGRTAIAEFFESLAAKNEPPEVARDMALVAFCFSRSDRRMQIGAMLECGANPFAAVGNTCAFLVALLTKNDAALEEMLVLCDPRHPPGVPSLLHIACMSGSLEAVQMLCKWLGPNAEKIDIDEITVASKPRRPVSGDGSEPDAKKSLSLAPIDIAAERGISERKFDIFSFLRSIGAIVETPSFGRRNYCITAMLDAGFDSNDFEDILGSSTEEKDGDDDVDIAVVSNTSAAVDGPCTGSGDASEAAAAAAATVSCGCDDRKDVEAEDGPKETPCVLSDRSSCSDEKADIVVRSFGEQAGAMFRAGDYAKLHETVTITMESRLDNL